ncbi:MAG: cytochrome c3 family protein [Gillisia sp.]|nr:cytochrome c3 family protein [Gillisia sp.]
MKIADFNNTTFINHNVKSAFFKKEGAYYVNLEGPDGAFQDYKIVYTFGMYHYKVSCKDCHNLHSLTLKKTGNALCLNCHLPKYYTQEHHHHKLNT